MKKIILAVTLLIGILFAADNAFCYTIFDATHDSIGYPTYELFKIDVNFSGNNVVFDLFTNYDGQDTVGSWTTYAADLAIDANGDNKYEYGVAFRNHESLTSGELYRVNTSSNSILSNSWGTYNNILNGWYTSDHYAPYHHSGVGYSYNENKPVSIASAIGSPLSYSSIAWAGPGSSMPYWKASVTFDASSIYADPNFNGSLNVFYGGATCGNDFVSGKVPAPVPEPASLSLLGLGLFGLVFRRRK